MGETMHSNIQVGAKSEPKQGKRCKLQNMKPGQKSDDAITIIVIPPVTEDNERGHDERLKEALTSKKTSNTIWNEASDEALDGQMPACEKISINGVPLAAARCYILICANNFCAVFVSALRLNKNNHCEAPNCCHKIAERTAAINNALALSKVSGRFMISGRPMI